MIAMSIIYFQGSKYNVFNIVKTAREWKNGAVVIRSAAALKIIIFRKQRVYARVGNPP